MHDFIQEHAPAVTGALTGFDRLVIRGQLPISYCDAMEKCLAIEGVLLKDFAAWGKKKRDELVTATEQYVQSRKRPFVFLESSATDKAETARAIAAEAKIDEGLICVLKCVEPCRKYDIKKDPDTGHIGLVQRESRCAYLYHYAVHPLFGPMSARIQTFLPFTIQVYLNGREWLARQLDRAGVGYLKHDNTFVSVEDVARAQSLLDQQLTIDWQSALEWIARRLLPGYPGLFKRFEVKYSWTIHQSEVATDVMFRDPGYLRRLYLPLVREAISTFDSCDVIRFLGQRHLGPEGVRKGFNGEVVSDFKRRVEGVRVKHFVNKNSIKIYDKAAGHVLRVETTINEPRDFKVMRPAQGQGPKSTKRRYLRKSIEDISRRVEVCQQANSRYLDKLAAFSSPQTLAELVKPVFQTTSLGTSRVRGLRPDKTQDLQLLQAVSRGEFAINGFKNADLREILFPEPGNEDERRRLSAQVTRGLRLLRAHGLVERLPTSHRYQLTERGRVVITALLVAMRSDVQTLINAA